jgi:hypothetical protein
MICCDALQSMRKKVLLDGIPQHFHLSTSTMPGGPWGLLAAKGWLMAAKAGHERRNYGCPPAFRIQRTTCHESLGTF